MRDMRGFTEQFHGRLQAIGWLSAAVCVLLVTTVFVVHERNASQRRIDSALVRGSNGLYGLEESGVLVGDSSAPIRVVEFLDFECRYCRRLQPILKDLRLRHPRTVAIVYRHFPMSRFGFAFPAAVAAQCAAEDGKYEQLAEQFFMSQDTLSRLSLESAAWQAGVEDTVRFRTCRLKGDAFVRVKEDVRTARALGIVATPTLVIRDSVRVGEISLPELESWIEHMSRKN